MRLVSALSLVAALASCGPRPETEPAEPAAPVSPASSAEDAEPSRLEYRTAPKADSHPFRQGFTQRPSRRTPGLPPPPEPLFSPDETARLQQALASTTDAERRVAQQALRSWIDGFESTAEGLGADERQALLAKVRGAARDAASAGRLDYRTAEELYREFIFPNDVQEAERRHAGEVVLLTGTVAPHNMLDLADGFKLFEKTPYVQEPVLLATDFELSFVRCHLAIPEIQKLRDWEEIHVLGIVDGKERGDVILRRCVVVSDPAVSGSS